MTIFFLPFFNFVDLQNTDYPGFLHINHCVPITGPSFPLMKDIGISETPHLIILWNFICFSVPEFLAMKLYSDFSTNLIGQAYPGSDACVIPPDTEFYCLVMVLLHLVIQKLALFFFLNLQAMLSIAHLSSF